MTGRTAFPALGTTAVVCTIEPDALAAAVTAVRTEVDAVDAACSRFRDDSELTAVNRGAGGPIRVGALLLEAVRAALRAAEATDGLVDPTIGRTLRLAGYDRTFELLSHGILYRASFAPVPGWASVEVDDEAGTIRVPPGTELDLGATAKALAVDRAASAAAAAARCGVLVSLGGDLAVAGDAPPHGWSIKLADDHAADLSAPGPSVAVAAGGLATSGTRVRRWRVGDTELHHIIDPRTGRPADTPWRTATVAAASCLDANVASTAAIVLGDEAPAWLEERRLPARLLAEDGSVVAVGGWPAAEVVA